jgi:dUTP pyrophosphatase
MMAHYECSVCGEVLCNDTECDKIKQQRRAEHMSTPISTPELIREARDQRLIKEEGAIQFLRIHPDAKIPTLGTPQSAGYDLYAVEDTVFDEDEIKPVPLGFATVLPSDIHGRIEARSGMAIKYWPVVTGVIDADYRGEWKVILANYTGEKRTIKAGDRIAQLVLRPTIHRDFVAVEKLAESQRGAGGFGSTGTR